MKAYNVLTLLVISVLTVTCDSFLDVKPSDRFTQQQFWKTSDDAQAALTGVYNVLTNQYIYGTSILFFEVVTPNAYHLNNNYDISLMARGEHDANAAIAFEKWRACYTGIGRANMLLANIDKVAINSATKKQFTGEARFLRALYYFNLWSLYGGVPLILDAPDLAAQGSLPRNNADEVFAQVLSDLDSAVANLPKVQADKGRATQGAALALKARAYLYAGDWANAAAAAKAVMNLNAYSLYADYRGLFFLENEGNSEVVFDVQFKYPEYPHSFDITLDAFNSIAPLQNLIDDYYMTDGLSIQSSPLYNVSQPFANRDPRLLGSIMYPGSKYRGTTVVAYKTYPQTSYSFKKFTVYKDDLAPSVVLSGGQSEINYIVIRYADVLLMYAEAQNEAMGPDASVYNALNLIRLRAKMPPVAPGLSRDQMRTEIRHERRIELAGEGHYYFDIRRWRIAETVMNGDVFGYQNKKIETRTFNLNRDYLWPIPSIAIQKNMNLVQNPLYGQ